MNENHYNSLITLGFVSVSLAFAYFTMRDTEHISISEENIKKKCQGIEAFLHFLL